MSFTPNPATDETILELKTDNIENYSEGDEWEMEIYNQQLVLIQKIGNIKDKKQIINTSGWIEGMYFVRVKLNNNLFTGKIVVAK